MTALRRPISQKGRVANRWAQWQREQREEVTRRCYGRCESCGTLGVHLDWEHSFGSRKAVVGEPLASHAVMTEGMCRPCHNEATAHPTGAVRVGAMLRALNRAAQTWPYVFDPLDVARAATPTGTEDLAAVVQNLRGLARLLEERLHEDGTLDTMREEAGR